MELEEKASKYEKIKQQARERQKRYYSQNKDKVSAKKKEQRELFNELKAKEKSFQSAKEETKIEETSNPGDRLVYFRLE